jgi:acyl-CoA thioesterase FadM
MTEPSAWTAVPTGPSDLDPGLTGRSDRPVPGIDNGFLAGYRVRFDEAGPDGVVRSSAYLRYAQDIAWRHSEDRGFDRAWYAQQGRWWVVRAVDLEVRSPILMGRTIRLATAVVGHRRIWARRHGEARAVDGTLVAVIDTDWVIVDGRGRIVRIPDDFGDAFPNPEIEGEILRAGRGPEPEHAARSSTRVRPQDLDPMGHVNNAVYLDWIDEALVAAGLAGASRLPRRLRMEYAASAGPGVEVEIRTWTVGDGWSARLIRAGDGAELVRATGSPA